MSFEKTRINWLTKFLLNGKDYFNLLEEDLKKAQKEIFIAGWFFVADLYLQRGYSIEEYQKNMKTIGDILLEKAYENLKIKIILWNNDLQPLGLIFKFFILNILFHQEQLNKKRNYNMKILKFY